MNIILKPLKGPTASNTRGFHIDFSVNPRFLISRMRNWRESPVDYEIGDLDGIPCLFIKDGFLSFPHAELIYVGGKIGIREARDNIKNHIYINVKIPTQTNYVTEAILKIGDSITFGKNVLRVEGQSPEQKLISHVYPDLAYIQSIADGGNLHLCKTKTGQDVFVEYHKYSALTSHLKRLLLEFKQQYDDLKKKSDRDDNIKQIVPKVFDIELMEGDSDGFLFIVREKIYSQSLEQIVIKEKKVFTVEQAITFGSLLTDGLLKLQRITKKRYQNIFPNSIHYDLHSSTPRIVFDKVMDVNFFISKSDPMAHSSFTPEMVYWPPEYIEFGRYTERSQIYGISLLILTTMLGEPPILARDSEELKEALDMNRIKFPEGLPKHLKEMLKRGVEISPNRRFFSLAEFKLGLSQFKKQLLEKSKLDSSSSSVSTTNANTQSSSSITRRLDKQ